MIDGSQLRPGDRIAVGSTLVALDAEFCSGLEPGDRVFGVASSGAVKRIPAHVASLVDHAMASAVDAFREMSRVSGGSLAMFYDRAASLLSDDSIFVHVQAANSADVEDAKSRGRSTTRLILSDKMRLEMVDSFRMWRDSNVEPMSPMGGIRHNGWEVSQWRAPLGVIGFVFEGRPNVFADATGVLKSGNVVVFRIGSDALRTARSIMEHIVRPALSVAGIPESAVTLLDSPEHAAGWALFSDSRLALAVARGSGQAVAELGSIAQQSGVPVSLHGTGGAWILVGDTADPVRLRSVVKNSLDRKVCNTANVITVNAASAERLIPVIWDGAIDAARSRGSVPLVRAVGGSEKYLPKTSEVIVERPEGQRSEDQVSIGSIDELGFEFEWENNPEFHLVVVATTAEAIELFNAHSPQFIVSVISEDDAEKELVWLASNAPFVGDGFTRWVDGQFALLRPELGLSNWQQGRLFARSGILSGDSAFSVRLRVDQDDPELKR